MASLSALVGIQCPLCSRKLACYRVEAEAKFFLSMLFTFLEDHIKTSCRQVHSNSLSGDISKCTLKEALAIVCIFDDHLDPLSLMDRLGPAAFQVDYQRMTSTEHQTLKLLRHLSKQPIKDLKDLARCLMLSPVEYLTVHQLLKESIVKEIIREIQRLKRKIPSLQLPAEVNAKLLRSSATEMNSKPPQSFLQCQSPAIAELIPAPKPSLWELTYLNSHGVVTTEQWPVEISCPSPTPPHIESSHWYNMAVTGHMTSQPTTDDRTIGGIQLSQEESSKDADSNHIIFLCHDGYNLWCSMNFEPDITAVDSVLTHPKSLTESDEMMAFVAIKERLCQRHSQKMIWN